MELPLFFLTGNVTTLLGFNESRIHIESLAYDWMGHNLYFCDSGSAEIGIINTTGKHRKILIGSSVLGKPRAMAVHPAKGYVKLFLLNYIVFIKHVDVFLHFIQNSFLSTTSCHF